MKMIPRSHHRPRPNGQHHRRRGHRRRAPVLHRILLSRQRAHRARGWRRPAPRKARRLPRALGRRRPLRRLHGDDRPGAPRPRRRLHDRHRPAEAGRPGAVAGLPGRLPRRDRRRRRQRRRAHALRGEGDGKLHAGGRRSPRRLPAARHPLQHRRDAQVRPPLPRAQGDDRARRHRRAHGRRPPRPHHPHARPHPRDRHPLVPPRRPRNRVRARRAPAEGHRDRRRPPRRGPLRHLRDRVRGRGRRPRRSRGQLGVRGARIGGLGPLPQQRTRLDPAASRRRALHLGPHARPRARAVRLGVQHP